MYKFLQASALLLAAGCISACEIQKSSNPLSPAVAGPIPGVNITTPRLTEPQSGAKIAASAQPITLTIENATSNGPRPLTYLFEVSTDAQFATKVVTKTDVAPGATGRTSVTLPVLETDKTYYWRALARDGANTGTYGPVMTFAVFTPAVLDVPTIVAPVNGATTSNLTPTLTFRNAVRSGPVGTVRYLVTINTIPSLAAAAVGFWWVTEQAGGVTSFVVPAGMLTAGKQYYWTVMSTDGTVGGNYARVESFTTPAGVVAAPTPPPGGGSGGGSGGGTGGGGGTGAGGGAARDAINIGAVRFYSPVNPAAYTATVALTGVEFRSGEAFGVRPIFDRTVINRRWPDVTPPGWGGALQWTLYAGFQIGGVWHMGGFIEFWGDRRGAARVWSGAHPLELVGGRPNWQANWAYDGRWGALSSYVPRAGDQMALMMVAGAVRPGSTSHPSVAERSSIIVVPLQANGTF